MPHQARRLLVIAATFISILAAAGCGGESKIDAAYDKCFNELKGGEELLAIDRGDNGKSISIDLQDDDEDGAVGVTCILKELHPSDALVTDIDNTTSMMGRQTETENGLTYRWSYHPDNGLEMTIREN